MIFVTVGSQKFQFDRLLRYMDELVKRQEIQEEIFAQTGFCDYQPKNIDCKNFLDSDEYSRKMSESRIVITHGGTASIMGAVKAGKKVIAVARLSKYKEHVDDHQEEIIRQFMEKKIIAGVLRLEDIKDAIARCDTLPPVTYQSGTESVIESIDAYIRRCRLF